MRDVAPGARDGDQKCFELDESRGFEIGAHVRRLYRSCRYREVEVEVEGSAAAVETAMRVSAAGAS